MNILEKILVQKRAEIRIAKDAVSEAELEESEHFARRCADMTRSLESAPCPVIAEFKRKSPSKGFINENASPEEIVLGYDACGAAASSVLTDKTFFGGSTKDLLKARAAAENLPLLRKEFIVDFYQIKEAKACGADAVLLIAAALDKNLCAELAECAHSVGLQVLLEIHSYKELNHACKFVDMLGVNNRNLETFKTDCKTSLEIFPDLPDGFTKVSESGISNPQDARKILDCGYRGLLIGETFMRNSNPPEALKRFMEEVAKA